MGCDGGTAATRRDIIVKTKKNDKKIDKETLLQLKWTTCALSEEPLKQPIVCCKAGLLYNKEALINALLDRREKLKKLAVGSSEVSNNNSQQQFSLIDHVQSLRDVIDVKFATSEDDQTSKDSDTQVFICPVTKQEIQGHAKFFCLPNCGHVISEKALSFVLNESTSGTVSCMICSKECNKSDLILLNPPDELAQELKKKLIQQHQQNKSTKKKKKSKTTTKKRKRVDEKDHQQTEEENNNKKRKHVE